MKLTKLKRWRLKIITVAADVLRWARADFLSGAERISKIALVLIVGYFLYAMASLIEFLLPGG